MRMPKPTPDPRKAARRTRAGRILDQVPHNRRACRRHALPADAVINKRKAFEEESSRGRRYGQETMRCANAPGGQQNAPDRPIRSGALFNEKRGADDVCNQSQAPTS